LRLRKRELTSPWPHTRPDLGLLVPCSVLISWHWSVWSRRSGLGIRPRLSYRVPFHFPHPVSLTGLFKEIKCSPFTRWDTMKNLSIMLFLEGHLMSKGIIHPILYCLYNQNVLRRYINFIIPHMSTYLYITIYSYV
jgi:hypothetical protein